MFAKLLLTVVFHVTAVTGSNYTVTELKDEVSGSWSLSQFSEIIQQAIISSVPFPWETIEHVLDSEEEVDMAGLAQQMITHELPLLVPACLGVVLAILVPMITLFFCCCRCCCGRCGRCGGKLSVHNVRNHKLHCMFINAFIAVTMVAILSAMACCIPLSGERMQTSPRLIFRTVNASLDDIPTFLEKFVEDASNLTMEVLNTAIDDIKYDLDDLPDTLSDPVTDGARPYVDKIESKIDLISNEIDSLKIAEAEINNTVDAMILYSNNLQIGLANINGLYGTIKSDCVNDGKTFCGSLPDGSGPDALNVSIDNTKLTDLAVEVTKLVSEANKVNLTEYSSLGNTTFEEVPNTIRNASQDAIDTVKATLDTVQGDLEPEIDHALEAAKFDLDLSDDLDSLDGFISELENNKHIIESVFMALGCILFLIAMTALVGLMLGVLCTKKSASLTQTGRTKAGNCGACLLMMSVCVAVFPLLLVLLLGSTLMLLGGNFTIICAPLQDLTVFSRLVDSGLLFGGENLGEKFFNDSSLNMSVTDLFKTCRNDGTVYTGLNLESIMNLSSIFNADEFVPDLGDSVVDEINTTIKDISIVDTSLFDDLKSQLELPDMDANTAQEVEDELNGIDLEGKALEINDLADTIPDQIYADKYRAIGTGLQELHNNSKVPLLQSLGNLTTILDVLNSTSQTMKIIITDLSQDLDNLTSYIETKAIDTIVQTLEDFLEGMKSVPDTLINTVLNALSTTIGRCKVLADIYDTVIASLCDHFLDAFNVLWASCYTGGMVCVVLMISSCTLSKYFRTPNDMVYTQHQTRQNLTNNSNSSPGGANVDLIYYKSLAESNTSNNAVYTKTNYRRIHQKWKQRRRFITGPFSAQFFAGNVGVAKAQTENGLIKDSLDESRDHGPLCTVVELDCSKTDIACCSQSLPSFEDELSQEILATSDDKQKDSILMGQKRFEDVKEVEVPVNCCDAVNGLAKSSIKHLKSSPNSKCNENGAFPYFQLVGDEFILIPMSQLNMESHEHNDNTYEIKNEEDQHAQDTYESELNTCTNHEHVGNDQWLSSYKIDMNPGQTCPSPLVKYSCENEKFPEENNKANTIQQENRADGATFSNLGYIESDQGSDVSGNLDDEDSEMNVDVQELLAEKSRYLIENMNRDHLDEMEYPVQEIVCSLCKSVRVENMKRKQERNKGAIFAFDESVDVHTQPLIKQGKVEGEHITDESASYFKTTVSNADIGKLSKSLENSFNAFDDTFQNMSGSIDSARLHQTGEQVDPNRTTYRNDYNESHSKLNIDVKPYRSLKIMRSPQSAFLFWKYIEENCNCPSNNVNSWPGELLADIDTNLENSLKQDNICGAPEILQCEKCTSENVEIFPQSKQNGCSKEVICNEPDSLVSLAVTAGRLAHVRYDSKAIDTNNIEAQDDRLPESLTNLSKAIPRMQVHQCATATTRKSNTQVSYV